MRRSIEKFGKHLSQMIMPNIGAFIAWGLITAMFISRGWFPNESLSGLVDPMLRYLLPLLIGYTGGRNVGGARGGVIGAIATMGVIAGSDIPMFIGAMAIGPLSGWVIKKFDFYVSGRIAAGFEMLVNNFSLGILGIGCAVFGFYGIGPVVGVLTQLLSSGVSLIMAHGMLPLVSVFIEPAKVLFLNNAINHGILTPIGLEQVQNSGSSIMFLLEANPGSGLGVLLAYWFFAEGNMKSSAPGAAIIHFLGGIHEIYFPYILMRPVLIIAPILGSASAILVYSLFGGGLVAPASPGSVFALLAMAPKGNMLVTLLGVVVAAVVSFLVSIPVIRKMPVMQSTETSASTESTGNHTSGKKNIRKIIFACDAGMGSSAMGATRFRNKLQKHGIEISVSNSSVDHIPEGTDLVVCQSVLADRARNSAPDAELVVIHNFLNDAGLDQLLARLENNNHAGSATIDTKQETAPEEANEPILKDSNILLGLKSESKEESILRAGNLLVSNGYVSAEYVPAMLERELLTTTYLGMGIAIPHGTSEAKDKIKKTGIVFLQYPEGVSYGEEKAHLVIGIAGKGEEHIDILAGISSSLEEEAVLQELINTEDKAFVLASLNQQTHIKKN